MSAPGNDAARSSEKNIPSDNKIPGPGTNSYSYLYGAVDGSSGTSSSQHQHQHHPQTAPLMGRGSDTKDGLLKREDWDSIKIFRSKKDLTHAVTVGRLAGVGYLLIILLAMFSEALVRSAVMVENDPRRTARNIRENALLFKCGFVADVAAFSCDILVNGALYLLLKESGALTAILAMLFRLAQASVLGANLCFHWLALLCATPSGYLKDSFSPPQLDSLSLMSLRMHKIGYSVALCFFAVNCGLTGWLIYHSPLFPSTLGVFLGLAAVTYIVDNMSMFFLTDYETPAFMVLILVVSEFSLCGFLLVKGVFQRPVDKNR